MEIKRTDQKFLVASLGKWFSHRSSLKRLLSVLAAGILFLLVVVGSVRYGVNLYISGQANTYHEFLQSMIWTARTPFTTAEHVAQGFFAQPEQLVFNFKFEDWQALQQKQQDSVRDKTLYASANPWINATVDYMGEKIKVDVRLKGAPDHYTNTKWSLRVRVDGDKAIMGMKNFAIQHPETRLFLSEWIFHKFLDYQGVLSLNYDFVNVTINGRNMGIYALEEQVEKQAIERNSRKEGPIVVFDEDLYNINRWQTPWRNRVRELKVYEDETIFKDDLLTSQFLAARSLIQGFTDKKISTCELFDCPVLAKYFASLDILGAQHAAGSGNMKMYYNPISAHFEPIGFDAESEYFERPRFLQAWSHFKAIPDSIGWFHEIFSDPVFMEQYIIELNRLTDPKVLDDFFDSIRPEMNEKLGAIYTSYPTYNFNSAFMYREQKLISEILHPAKALDAYIDSVEGSTITLDVGTILPVPTLIRTIRYEGKEIPLVSPVYLKPLILDKLVEYGRIQVSIPEGFHGIDRTKTQLEIGYSIIGLDEVRYEYPSVVPKRDETFFEGDIVRQPGNANTFPFLRTDDNAKEIRALAGTWKIVSDLIIPKGYTFVMGPSTTLELTGSAQILSHSPVRWVGEQGRPIVVRGATEEAKGVAVLQAGGRSQLTHVVFENLAAPSSGSWEMTGAVNFYQSPVDVVSCVFRGNRASDDALNIIRSPFTLTSTSFADTLADALDVDFSKGTIKDMRVTNSGNDGLDISGSDIQVSGYEGHGIGDKGMSIGESSYLQGKNISITRARIGVASKDLSRADLDTLRIEQSEIALALYQKKAEFGPSHLSLWNVIMKNNAHESMVEMKSLLKIDDEVQPAIIANVAAKVD